MFIMIKEKKTKIVATIGPASDSEEIIKGLIKSGVNVFRFNMKHNELDWHNERISKVQKIADDLFVPIGILIDLQGPEIRIYTKNQQDINLKKGEKILVEKKKNKQAMLTLSHDQVIDSLKVGDSFLVDDGFNEFEVTKKLENKIELTAIDEVVIKNKKGVNLPGIDIDLPSLIKDDLRKLDMASKTMVDYIALSFCRTKKDINTLKREMDKRNIKAKIVAKIENQKSLDNLEELIEYSDVVMIARGDLGVETPIERLAFWQKKIILLCRKYRKPVIVATQMLESMTNNPRPTRAEATDVANAILDGTDAVMLSGETAGGKYPIKAVEAMTSILKYNEENTNLEKVIPKKTTITDLVIEATRGVIENKSEIKIDAILVFTETGQTARTIASHRFKIPVFALTDNIKTVQELTLSYGINPLFQVFPKGAFVSAKKIIEKLINKKVFSKDQNILVIHGQHWQASGLTNSLSIIKV